MRFSHVEDKIHQFKFIVMSNFNKQHAADFAQWRSRHPHEVFDTSEEAGITSTLKVGDKVTFTNGYGVKFPGHRVLGFCKPTLGNRCVYLDIDCYWFPAGLDELKLEE